jgi:hypothetical protein
VRRIPKRPRGFGGVWLAANTIGTDNWGEWLIPGLFVVWGAVLLRLRSDRSSRLPSVSGADDGTGFPDENGAAPLPHRAACRD